VPKNAFNESDEDVNDRLGKPPTWQYFSGNDYFVHHWPYDPTQLGHFRKALGEEGVEELLGLTMKALIGVRSRFF
jgi:IS5 family transposase